MPSSGADADADRGRQRRPLRGRGAADGGGQTAAECPRALQAGVGRDDPDAAVVLAHRGIPWPQLVAQRALGPLQRRGGVAAHVSGQQASGVVDVDDEHRARAAVADEAPEAPDHRGRPRLAAVLGGRGRRREDVGRHGGPARHQRWRAHRHGGLDGRIRHGREPQAGILAGRGAAGLLGGLGGWAGSAGSGAAGTATGAGRPPPASAAAATTSQTSARRAASAATCSGSGRVRASVTADQSTARSAPTACIAAAGSAAPASSPALAASAARSPAGAGGRARPRRPAPRATPRTAPGAGASAARGRPRRDSASGASAIRVRSQSRRALAIGDRAATGASATGRAAGGREEPREHGRWISAGPDGDGAPPAIWVMFLPRRRAMLRPGCRPPAVHRRGARRDRRRRRPAGPTSSIPVERALGRVLAEDVTAAGDVPPFAGSGDGRVTRCAPAPPSAACGSSASRVPARPFAARALGDGEACASRRAPRCRRRRRRPAARARQDGGRRRSSLGRRRPGRNVRGAGEDLRAGARRAAPRHRLQPGRARRRRRRGRAELRCAPRRAWRSLGTGDELRPTRRARSGPADPQLEPRHARGARPAAGARRARRPGPPTTPTRPRALARWRSRTPTS